MSNSSASASAMSCDIPSPYVGMPMPNDISVNGHDGVQWWSPVYMAYHAGILPDLPLPCPDLGEIENVNHARHLAAVSQRLGHVVPPVPEDSDMHDYKPRTIESLTFYIKSCGKRGKQCPMCEEVVNRENIESHIRSKHLFKKPLKYTCQDCKIRLTNNHNFEAHRRKCKVLMGKTSKRKKYQYQCSCGFTTEKAEHSATHYYEYLYQRNTHQMISVNAGKCTQYVPTDFVPF